MRSGFKPFSICTAIFFPSVLAQTAEDVAFSTLNFSGILNATWDSQVRQVCSAAATTARASSSASGLVICYNVAAVQPSTGLFLGDLRVYVAGQSSLSAVASLQTSMDFVKVAVIRNTTESQGQAVQSFKRSLFADQRAHHDARILPRQVSGLQAAVASPQPGIRPILATARLGEGTTPAAILPGERRIVAQKRTAITTNLPSVFVSGPLNMSLIRPSVSATTNGFQIPGTQVQTIQFLGMIRVETALSNPDGTGVLGALLPRISLLVSMTGQANTTLAMNDFTQSFLLGVKGTGRPAGTFILPGRKLGGADGSASLVGLYLVGAYTLLLIVTLFGSFSTRWHLRRRHRSKS